MSVQGKDGRTFLDDEERDLIEGAEAVFDDPTYRPPTDDERTALQTRLEAMVAESRKRKPVTFRLQGRDIEQLKSIALRKGMPYQTLVASILHQYVNGDLVEK